MSDTALKTQYRDEFIAGFEMRQSLLRTSCITQTMADPNGGNAVVFLVADSGSATAVTRGSNGLIPARPDNLTQSTCTLVEWHDLARKTRFNIFAGQGDQRSIMQMTTMAVVNRKIDDDIIAQLDTATNDTGAATTANLNLVMKARTILGVNYVPIEEQDNMFALVSPAFIGYLMQVKEFASADYVEVKPMVGPARSYRRWAGFNWIEHARLTGANTSSEKCYFYHRNSIGHAADSDSIKAPVGYDEEQDYYWARCSMFMGSKLLQNSGVVQVLHDGSAFTAT